MNFLFLLVPRARSNFSYNIRGYGVISRDTSLWGLENTVAPLNLLFVCSVGIGKIMKNAIRIELQIKAMWIFTGGSRLWSHTRQKNASMTHFISYL